MNFLGDKDANGNYEFLPESEQANYIEYDCGCTIRRVTDGTGITTYVIETFCLEHDPTLNPDYDGDSE